MLYIKKGELNNVVVTVSQNKTLSSPNYLFSFEHILSKEKVRFYPKNISTSTARYDEFSFYEGEEPLGYTGDTPYVTFPFEGQYYYGVYEMMTTASTNPSYAFSKLEEGRTTVEDLSNPEEFYQYISSNENNDNFIYYGDDYNREFYVFNSYYSDNRISGQTMYMGWNEVYPPLTVLNTYTNETTKYDFNLSEYNICDLPWSARTDVFQEQFTAGGTGYIKYYYDSDDLTTYGYGNIATPFYVSASTMSGFNFNILTNEWDYESTITFSNGTTAGPITKSISDISSPYELLDIGLLSGFTGPCIPPTPTPTPTASVTPTPTTTPTQTVTPSITPSLTPEASPTPTPTVTPTFTPTPSITPSFTPTATLTPTPTPNFYKILTESGGTIGTEQLDDTLNTEDLP